MHTKAPHRALRLSLNGKLNVH
jgi:sulfur relay (sulfurtransferase) complex TusBCD TusD component (DsrE family)